MISDIKTDCTVGLECHDSLTFVVTKLPEDIQGSTEGLPPFPIALRVQPASSLVNVDRYQTYLPSCRCESFYELVPASAEQYASKFPQGKSPEGSIVCSCVGQFLE